MENQKPSKALNISLWVAQVLLAGMFAMAGLNKIFQSIDELAKMLPWATQVPLGLVRFIGVSELAGALGLLLPALLRIKPVLTPFAAIGLATVMLFASIFHISRGENSMIGMNGLIMAIAIFVAWGRMKKVPIHAK